MWDEGLVDQGDALALRQGRDMDDYDAPDLGTIWEPSARLLWTIYIAACKHYGAESDTAQHVLTDYWEIVNAR